jgi:tetratricopeptide (TPR) repeat protein
MQNCATGNEANHRVAGAKPAIRASLLILVLSAGLFLGNCSAFRQNPDRAYASGKEALRAGDYAEARQQFEAVLKSASGTEAAQMGLLQALRETGAYDEAAKRADAFLAAKESSAGVQLERGRVAVAQGQYEAAEKHLRRAVALGGAGRTTALRELAATLELIGRRSEAESVWNSIIDLYRRRQLKGSQELGDAAFAAWKLDYHQDAKDIFIDATSPGAGEVSLESLSNFGYLFLEKYNATDATGVFRDCLKINKAYPPALLGIALVKKFEGAGDVVEPARATLKINPNYVPAMNLLASVAIEEEDLERGMREIRRALAVNPNDLESLSLEAVCRQFQGDAGRFAELERRILAINPAYGQMYYILAENLVMRRKYQEAVDLNRKAIELDPRLWGAHAGLGMNLMRVGALQQGREALRRAFEGDPFNVWAYNTLDLLDQMDKFAQVDSEHFTFKMDPEDRPVLTPYATRLAEEVYAKLSQRYGFTPQGPIQIEIFPDHGGFAVRTLGLPGLGALGVCFGKVVALDSPRARKQGSFNWGSTLWHEFAHVISLQMTNHNIPRWFSEGISVYEERRARPGWGDQLTAAVLRAYKEGRLLKVSELNAGMMRPKHPEQVGLSYYQASLVCELIEERFGFEKLRESLKLFAQNKTTDEVFRQTLGWDTARFDSEYAKFLDARLAAPAGRLIFNDDKPGHGRPELDKGMLRARLAQNPDDFFASWGLGAALHKDKAFAEAEPYLKRAAELFPEFTEPGNPHQLLSEIYLEQKREEDALRHLTLWARNNSETAYPLVRAAEIYTARKDWASAAKLLELSIFVQPYDPEIYKMLGQAAAESKNWASAVSAYQVMLGLNPPDPAGVHLRLAQAWLGSGKKTEAKREVLRALEIAPSFDEAQELLLKLSGGAP